MYKTLKFIPKPQAHFDTLSPYQDKPRKPRQLDPSVLQELLEIIREAKRIRDSAPYHEDTRDY